MSQAQRKKTIPLPLHPVLSALQRITSGALFVTCADGTELVCGKPGQDIAADMHIYQEQALDLIAEHGDIGLGEGYMHGLWDTTDLSSLIDLFARNMDTLEKYADAAPLYRNFYHLKNKLRANTFDGSRKNIQSHYDLGNDFYRLWLDETMTYSGALFRGNDRMSLNEAQKAKYQRILERLAPLPSDHILEIGCGWGGFMTEAAKKDYHTTGVTLSPAQADLARQRLTAAGLGRETEVRLQDYRDIREKFDHVVSIGMFEHVGEEFWPEYMQKVRDCLKPFGKAMIQTIVVPDGLFEQHRTSSSFLREHIFPGGLLPSPARFKQVAEKAGLTVNDTFFFGGDYAITLEKWLNSFEKNLTAIRKLGVTEEFIRKWRFYLVAAGAMFKIGRINLMQAELCRGS